MAKGNGGTRGWSANAPKASSVDNSIEGFMSSLGYAYNPEPTPNALGELNSKGEIQLSAEQQKALMSALAKRGTDEELTQSEADSLHTLLHEIGHYTALDRGLDSQGGVFMGSGIDKVSEVMNNIWAEEHLASFASRYGMKMPSKYQPKDDAYRRLQGNLDRVMDILAIDKRAVYSDIAADRVDYTGYHGIKGKGQGHQALAAIIERQSGGRVSAKLALDIIDNVAGNSRDNEYRPKGDQLSRKRAAQIINENGLAKHKVYDYMFIGRENFDNSKRSKFSQFTPAQIKKYNQF